MNDASKRGLIIFFVITFSIFCLQFGQLFSYTWEFGELCCKVLHYMQNVSAICSVLTLTAMSVER